jgi:hypothetical protein
LSYSWFQTGQTGGQWYTDISPFSIPSFVPTWLLLQSTCMTAAATKYMNDCCCYKVPAWLLLLQNTGMTAAATKYMNDCCCKVLARPLLRSTVLTLLWNTGLIWPHNGEIFMYLPKYFSQKKLLALRWCQTYLKRFKALQCPGRICSSLHFNSKNSVCSWPGEQTFDLLVFPPPSRKYTQ